MSKRLIKKYEQRISIRKRIRKKISGTGSHPRLAVFRSGRHVYVQAIDDTKGETLCAASSVEKEGRQHVKSVDQAKFVGTTLAEKLLAKGITTAVFDRGGRPYHGIIKVLADTAREKGLVF